MKKLLLLIVLMFPSLSLATVYTPTAFRINGTTATASSACNTTHVCDGWVLEIDVPTIGTTGTFTLGLGTNNNPKNANVIVTVTSSGYEGGANCGTTTTYKRTLYATHILREPYNNASTNDVTSSAGTTTFRLALAGGPGPVGTVTGPGWVFSADTVTVQVASSFFTDGSSNTVGTVAAGTSVTNNSTLAYSAVRAIGAWARPGWQRVTGTTQLGVLAFSQFAMNDLPASCVAVKWSDGTTTNTTNAPYPTIDITQPDLGGKVIEYLASMSTSGLINHDQLTANFKIYPWIGDSTAVFDSSDGTNSQPTPLYAPQYYLLDTTNAYAAAGYLDGSFTYPGSNTSGTFVAAEKVVQKKSSTTECTGYLIDVTGANGAGPIHMGQCITGSVDTTTGDTWTGQTSGAVFTQSGTTVTYAGTDSNSCAGAFSGGQPASACRTIDGALIKMAAYNNASSTPTHNDACGTLYMAQGYYNWTGASGSDSNTTGKCWATLTPASGVTQSQVVIDQQSGNQGFGTHCTSGSTSCGTPLHLQGITVNIATGPVSVFNIITYLWMDSDSITINGTAPFYQSTVNYFTWDTFGSVAYGLRPYGGVAMAVALVRGCNLNNLAANPIQTFTVIGNTTTASQNTFLSTEISGQTVNSLEPILAFNTFYKWTDTSNAFGLTYTTSSIVGEAVVQNIFENITASDSSPAMVGLTADGGTGTPVNNVMIWDNAIVGGRMNRAYQDSGTSLLLRQAWSEVGNIADDVAIKSDTFGTPSANRLGNWAELYGSGNRSTLYAATSYSADAGDFCPEFWGLNVYGTTITAGSTQPPVCTAANSSNYPQYVSRQASTGSTGTGGGNYNILSSSPAVNFFPAGTNILPYDLTGQIRNDSGWGSAGTYEQAKSLTPVFGW